jgi:hypothetical protein
MKGRDRFHDSWSALFDTESDLSGAYPSHRLPDLIASTQLREHIREI